ncbi:MAG: hypothetical protein R3B47_05655 [Bacteroidia bacterium]
MGNSKHNTDKHSPAEEQDWAKLLAQEGIPGQNAVSAFFTAHKKLVQIGSRKYNISEERALDAYTDAVIAKGQIDAGKFRGESKVKTYFEQIFSFKCIDAFKKRRLREAKSIELLENKGQSIPDWPKT